MSAKTIASIAAVTLLAVVAAFVVALARPAPAPVQYANEPVLPTLRAQPDAVAKVTIETGGKTIELNRTAPETWVAPGRSNYPADGEKIRQLVVQLADMRLVEPKTSIAERYPRLEVENVDAEDAKSRLIRVESADGEALGELLIGKRRYRMTGTETAGTYMRRPGDAQSWLASGGVDVEAEVQRWLDQEIVSIESNDVRRVEITSPEGDSYVVLRGSQEELFQLEDLAEGETLNPDANLNQLSGAFTAVTMTDVRPRGELAWPEQHYRAAVETFDGFGVTLRLAMIDNQPWALVDAQVGDLGKLDGEQADQVRQAAEALTDKTKDWAYQVNQSLFQRLTKPRDAWLAEADGTS